MKEPAPKIAKTQQRAKEPTPIAVDTQERVEPRVTHSEATTEQPDLSREQALSGLGSEQGFPDLGSEHILAPREGPRQPGNVPQEQPDPPISRSTQSTPTEGGEHGRENNTCQQWLRWLAEQVSDVADQLDVEERRRNTLCDQQRRNQSRSGFRCRVWERR